MSAIGTMCGHCPSHRKYDAGNETKAQESRSSPLSKEDCRWPNEAGEIVIESTPFTTGPQKLLGVREWKKKE